ASDFSWIFGRAVSAKVCTGCMAFESFRLLSMALSFGATGDARPAVASSFFVGDSALLVTVGLCVCSSADFSIAFLRELNDSWISVLPFVSCEADYLSKGINSAEIKISIDAPNNVNEIAVMALRM